MPVRSARRAATPHRAVPLVALTAVSLLAMLTACDDGPTPPTAARRTIEAPARPASSLAVLTMQISDTALFFPETPMSAASPTQKVFVKNVSTSPLTVDALLTDTTNVYSLYPIDFREPFSLDAYRPCVGGAPLEPGETCEIRVAFYPMYELGAGTRHGRLHVQTNQGTRTVELYGTSIVASDIYAGAVAASAETVQPGKTITWTIYLGLFEGSAPAANATMSTATPTGTTFVGITPPAGFTCVTPKVGGTGSITCKAPSLANTGAWTPFQLTTKVAGSAPEWIVAQATASTTSLDPNPNNSVSGRVQVVSKK